MMKFELFLGCLGNGVTVSNKAVLENGDYKKIAHISPAGNVAWYVPVESVPGDALLRIEHTAHCMESNTRERLRNAFKSDYHYVRILEEIGDYTRWDIQKEFWETLKRKRTIEAKHKLIEDFYIKHF